MKLGQRVRLGNPWMMVFIRMGPGEWGPGQALFSLQPASPEFFVEDRRSARPESILMNAFRGRR